MPFKPGQSGNPNGRPKKPIEEAALERFKQHFNNGNYSALLDALQRQINKGNVRAIEIALSYLVGKPAQAIELDQVGEVRITIVNDDGIGSEATNDDTEAA